MGIRGSNRNIKCIHMSCLRGAQGQKLLGLWVGLYTLVRALTIRLPYLATLD